MKVKKGNKYECIKSVRFSDGVIKFRKGYIYESEKNLHLINEDEERHHVGDDEWTKEHFIEVSHEINSVKKPILIFTINIHTEGEIKSFKEAVTRQGIYENYAVIIKSITQARGEESIVLINHAGSISKVSL